MAKPKYPTVKRNKDGSVEFAFRPGYAFEREGVTCDNPTAPLTERVYRIIFRRKRVYLAHELDLALNNHLREPNTVVLSMNGYSSLKADWLKRYGIREGAYEAACEALLRNTINTSSRSSRRPKYGSSTGLQTWASTSPSSGSPKASSV